MTACAEFAEQLRSDDLSFLMEAHNGISAKIAEAVGFRSLWASGFAISTSLGKRDCNEISWSTHLSVVRQITDACNLPVIVDGDNGFGTFNIARRICRAAERAGAAGICFEDKRFPKMNSFVDASHDLLPVGDFVGILRACVDNRANPDFCLIARTETLICGGTVGQAASRAMAYYEAGADAVFVHSRETDFEQIRLVAAELDHRVPLIISPTTYANTPTSEFHASGISAVIWANHSMRASVAAMWDLCTEVRRTDSTGQLETRISSLSDIFDLLAYDDLLADEDRYLKIPSSSLGH